MLVNSHKVFLGGAPDQQQGADFDREDLSHSNGTDCQRAGSMEVSSLCVSLQ